MLTVKPARQLSHREGQPMKILMLTKTRYDDGSDDENAERRGAGLWKEKLGDQQVGAAGVSSCLGIRRWEVRYIVLYWNILKYIGIYVY